MRTLFLFLILTFSLIAKECDYPFQGNHFIASYYGCSHEALLNKDGVQKSLTEACKVSGAEVLDYTDFHFDGDGYTMVVLLSESHASIHTYPEHNTCFVDLITCGDQCSHEKPLTMRCPPF